MVIVEKVSIRVVEIVPQAIRTPRFSKFIQPQVLISNVE